MIKSLDPSVIVKPPTPQGYIRYIFSDKSEIWLKPNGEIVRIPVPMYNANGSRIKGFQIDGITNTIHRPHELSREIWDMGK